MLRRCLWTALLSTTLLRALLRWPALWATLRQWTLTVRRRERRGGEGGVA